MRLRLRRKSQSRDRQGAGADMHVTKPPLPDGRGSIWDTYPLSPNP